MSIDTSVLKIIVAAAVCLVLGNPQAWAWSGRPYIVGAGAGAVYDEDNEFGWAFHLNALGHPGAIAWLQTGLEMQYYGHSERLVYDQTKKIEDGTRQRREYAQHAGYMAGLMVRFPIGFGKWIEGDEGHPKRFEGKRKHFDAAPIIGVGLHFDASSSRESVWTQTSTQDESVHKSPRSENNPTKGYFQAGIRWRYVLLEIVGAGQLIKDQAPQAVIRLGFDAPW